jgi:hypothetical protein
MHPLAVFAAFLVLALSPSFLDWQQADERQRKQILAYYGIAGAFILLGSE